MVQIEAIGSVTINPSNEMMPGKKGGPSVPSAVREKTVSTKEAYQNIVHSAEKEPRIQAKIRRFIEGESELITGDREATGGRRRGGGAVFHMKGSFTDRFVSGCDRVSVPLDWQCLCR